MPIVNFQLSFSPPHTKHGDPMDNDGEVFSSEMIESVRRGLGKSGQKELPCKYFYDEVGSALFEAICALPEYGLARAGERLLQEHSEELVRHLRLPVMVIELGSGSGRKARWILEALATRQRTIYCPIEISPSALIQSIRELESLDKVSVMGFKLEYLDGLREAAARRPPDAYLLVLFLGSTIGNFDDSSAINFLREIRRMLKPGDALLLATDLTKPASLLLPAYDDPIGVTSAFNLNILARLNRELGANFDIAGFRHEARFNPKERRIEMYLRSLRDQTVSIPEAAMTVRFAKDETIWTESSHKYTIEELQELALKTGFQPEIQWVDKEWPFAQTLLFVKS